LSDFFLQQKLQHENQYPNKSIYGPFAYCGVNSSTRILFEYQHQVERQKKRVSQDFRDNYVRKYNNILLIRGVDW